MITRQQERILRSNNLATTLLFIIVGMLGIKSAWECIPDCDQRRFQVYQGNKLSGDESWHQLRNRGHAKHSVTTMRGVALIANLMSRLVVSFSARRTAHRILESRRKDDWEATKRHPKKAPLIILVRTDTHSQNGCGLNERNWIPIISEHQLSPGYGRSLELAVTR